MSNHHKFVNSSSIDACDYNDKDGTLIIHFSSGACYHYPDCPREHYEALKKAESPGKHFHKLRGRIDGVKVK